MPSCLLAIDQGTTGTRALLYDPSGHVLASAYREFRQYYPQPGWVEHDANEIWDSLLSVLRELNRKLPAKSHSIAAIGLTNQRETTVLWDRKSGRPVSRAMVWQDRRTAPQCDALTRKGLENKFRDKTGLTIDPYFSASKIKWLLKHHAGLRAKAKKGDLLFGTIDTWLLWKLTGGQSHATDFTNASRTLLFNIRKRVWDNDLLRIFDVPRSILPQVQDSASSFGKTNGVPGLPNGIPIRAMIGDQQAALYGQSCYRSGQMKNTYGTGGFAMLNLGAKYQKPAFGLLTTLACDEKGKSVYAFEGAVFISGAAIQWLRDGLQLFKKASETEAMARKAGDNGGVTVIPALTGLGSPYWNPHARGAIFGLTRGTERKHIVRATLESLAHQTADVIEAMTSHRSESIRELKVDGGATHNRFLMQFQADLLRVPVRVSNIAESTAWGAAKLAGKAVSFWSGKLDAKQRYTTFRPSMKSAQTQALRKIWKENMQRLLFSPQVPI